LPTKTAPKKMAKSIVGKSTPDAPSGGRPGRSKPAHYRLAIRGPGMRKVRELEKLPA
jgi:hypothetical protein